MPISFNTEFWRRILPFPSSKRRDKPPFNDRSTSETSSSSNSKSVHFSDSTSSVYYTYGSSDYDRGSYDFDAIDIGQQLRTNDSFHSNNHDIDDDNEHSNSLDMGSINGNHEQELWDEQVRRNTKVNMKRGHHSIAILIQYRSNF